MKRSTFDGVDPVVRERTLANLRRQNEQNALDALKRAVLAKDHELYQLEIGRAEDYIRAVLGHQQDEVA